MPRSTTPATVLSPRRFARPSVSSPLKKRTWTHRLISSCATARAGSSFSMSKDTSTITMPTRSRFPSLGGDFLFQKSLPTCWAGQLPPLRGAAGPATPALVPGPDVIVGDLPEMAQYGSNGNFVGLGIGTTSCNNGDQPLDWFSLPNTDHPVIPQNFFRMSGGASNNDRFEQVGQSWLK